MRDDIALGDPDAIGRERRRRLDRLAEERIGNAVRRRAFDRGVRLERAFHLAAEDVLAADDDDVLDAIDDAEPPVRVHRRRVARAEPTPRREFRRRRGSRRRVPVPVEQRRAANENLADLLAVVRDGDERQIGRVIGRSSCRSIFIGRRLVVVVGRVGPSRDEHLDGGVVRGGDATRARQELGPVLHGRAPGDGLLEWAEKTGAHAPAHLGHAVVGEEGRVGSRGEKLANQTRRHVRTARGDEPKRREREGRRGCERRRRRGHLQHGGELRGGEGGDGDASIGDDARQLARIERGGGVRFGAAADGDLRPSDENHRVRRERVHGVEHGRGVEPNVRIDERGGVRRARGVGRHLRLGVKHALGSTGGAAGEHHLELSRGERVGGLGGRPRRSRR